MGGVISKTVTANSQLTMDNGIENNSAPTTKSIWSTIGNKPPGAIPNLLFKKAPVKSPKRAPKGINIAKKIGKPKSANSANPTIIPIAKPKKKPLKVLLLPKTRFRS